MNGDTQAKGKLRLVMGAGKTYEVSRETAAKYNGQVKNALADLIRAEIQDRELLRMLDEPRLVMELYGGQPEGEAQERPLYADDRWEDVVRELAESDQELGLAVSHRGGR
jgi:hypothetical protein